MQKTSHSNALFTEVTMDATVYGAVLKFIQQWDSTELSKNPNKMKKLIKNKKAKQIEIIFCGVLPGTSVERSAWMCSCDKWR